MELLDLYYPLSIYLFLSLSPSLSTPLSHPGVGNLFSIKGHFRSGRVWWRLHFICGYAWEFFWFGCPNILLVSYIGQCHLKVGFNSDVSTARGVKGTETAFLFLSELTESPECFLYSDDSLFFYPLSTLSERERSYSSGSASLFQKACATSLDVIISIIKCNCSQFGSLSSGRCWSSPSMKVFACFTQAAKRFITSAEVWGGDSSIHC